MFRSELASAPFGGCKLATALRVRDRGGDQLREVCEPRFRVLGERLVPRREDGYGAPEPTFDSDGACDCRTHPRLPHDGCGLSSYVRVVVEPSRSAALPYGCEHPGAVELPARSDRERIHALTPAADEFHPRAVRLVADQPDERDVDDARDLLRHNREELLRRRLARDEGRDSAKGGLLVGELAQVVLGLLRRGDVAQRSADQGRLGLDLA